jgi:hypothetical protein
MHGMETIGATFFFAIIRTYSAGRKAADLRVAAGHRRNEVRQRGRIAHGAKAGGA